MTYGGYDYLAMRAMSKRDTMTSVGNQIGVGKESGTSMVARMELGLNGSQTSTLSPMQKVKREY